MSSIFASPDQADAGTSDFQETVIPLVREQGGRGGILLLDRATGKALAVTLWSDEEQLRQSEDANNELRRRVSEEMQSTQPPTVERYEVAVFEA